MSAKQGVDKVETISKSESAQVSSKKYEPASSQQTVFSSKGGKLTVDNFSALVGSQTDTELT
jgi:hypothetical protein